jgi:hypothetical protein
MAASDALQVWLDVASHPARGREQADLIRKRVLQLHHPEAADPRGPGLGQEGANK